MTGAGAGQILGTESLEHDQRSTEFDSAKPKKKKKDDAKKSLSDQEAIAWVKARVPGVTKETAVRFINATRSLKASGRL
jgi:hypothetical protein